MARSERPPPAPADVRREAPGRMEAERRRLPRPPASI